MFSGRSVLVHSGLPRRHLRVLLFVSRLKAFSPATLPTDLRVLPQFSRPTRDRTRRASRRRDHHTVANTDLFIGIRNLPVISHRHSHQYHYKRIPTNTQSIFTMSEFITNTPGRASGTQRGRPAVPKQILRHREVDRSGRSLLFRARRGRVHANPRKAAAQTLAGIKRLRAVRKSVRQRRRSKLALASVLSDYESDTEEDSKEKVIIITEALKQGFEEEADSIIRDIAQWWVMPDTPRSGGKKKKKSKGNSRRKEKENRKEDGHPPKAGSFNDVEEDGDRTLVAPEEKVLEDMENWYLGKDANALEEMFFGKASVKMASGSLEETVDDVVGLFSGITMSHAAPGVSLRSPGPTTVIEAPKAKATVDKDDTLLDLLSGLQVSQSTSILPAAILPLHMPFNKHRREAAVVTPTEEADRVIPSTPEDDTCSLLMSLSPSFSQLEVKHLSHSTTSTDCLLSGLSTLSVADNTILPNVTATASPSWMPSQPSESDMLTMVDTITVLPTIANLSPIIQEGVSSFSDSFYTTPSLLWSIEPTTLLPADPPIVQPVPFIQDASFPAHSHLSSLVIAPFTVVSPVPAVPVHIMPAVPVPSPGPFAIPFNMAVTPTLSNSGGVVRSKSPSPRYHPFSRSSVPKKKKHAWSVFGLQRWMNSIVGLTSSGLAGSQVGDGRGIVLNAPMSWNGFDENAYGALPEAWCFPTIEPVSVPISEPDVVLDYCVLTFPSFPTQGVVPAAIDEHEPIVIPSPLSFPSVFSTPAAYSQPKGTGTSRSKLSRPRYQPYRRVNPINLSRNMSKEPLSGIPLDLFGASIPADDEDKNVDQSLRSSTPTVIEVSDATVASSHDEPADEAPKDVAEDEFERELWVSDVYRENIITPVTADDENDATIVQPRSPSTSTLVEVVDAIVSSNHDERVPEAPDTVAVDDFNLDQWDYNYFAERIITPEGSPIPTSCSRPEPREHHASLLPPLASPSCNFGRASPALSPVVPMDGSVETSQPVGPGVLRKRKRGEGPQDPEQEDGSEEDTMSRVKRQGGKGVRKRRRADRDEEKAEDSDGNQAGVRGDRKMEVTKRKRKEKRSVLQTQEKEKVPEEEPTMNVQAKVHQWMIGAFEPEPMEDEEALISHPGVLKVTTLPNARVARHSYLRVLGSWLTPAWWSFLTQWPAAILPPPLGTTIHFASGQNRDWDSAPADPSYACCSEISAFNHHGLDSLRCQMLLIEWPLFLHPLHLAA
ncbi:hypothetical protein Hypma_003071 [Hypsizygus marmoreus]|uniref:Uncharacterized protein n=1 Tax=Hypsizygus marmoreus TaxID=39966 RepID=A0A369JBU2_HYPMA|nr:hypothetical protein Hypma_003071 [Hypsizygus marmoreus]